MILTLVCHCSMIVYRVEHQQTGSGPYLQYNPAYKTLRDELNSNHDDELTHPAFQFDGIGDHPLFKISFHSGFEKLKDLNWWFKGFGQKLSENNFVIAIYEIEESLVIRGISGKQVAFDLLKAELLRAEAITFE